MQRILILMSNTGGGHRASAEALKAGFHQRFGDRFQIDIIDLLSDHLIWPLNRVPRTYKFLSDDAVWLWRLLWKSGNYPRQARRITKAAAQLTAHSVKRAFTAYAPDLIISVHALANDMAVQALARMERRIPFTIVVTDLATAHPLWFHPASARCYVASDEAYQRGRRVGLKAEQLRLYGLPIRPAFAQPLRPKASLRQEFGLDLQLPAALLMGGGEGIGPVAEVAQAVARRLAQGGRPSGQLVVVCGRNRRLQEELAAQAWPIPIHVKGFLENVHEWMGACDCIITKAGPGTIAEALICGLPILLSSYIPGQEEGNIPFVVNNEVGAYSGDPQQIAELVWRWFGPEQAARLRMAENARKLGHPQATLQIVESLAELLGENKD
jgi:1,2-diacylglycerol 3-beta-galactosyltransferase